MRILWHTNRPKEWYFTGYGRWRENLHQEILEMLDRLAQEPPADEPEAHERAPDLCPPSDT